jgi:5-methylcytosine-specific restriction endonuclease McrBC GTP-binding regulatory subunit McrB
MATTTSYLDALISDGTAVLEGVAGIGKTRSINETKDRLRDLPISAAPYHVQQYVQQVIKESGSKPVGSLLIQRLRELVSTEEPVVTIFVMHPSTCYEEMIGGLRPVPSSQPALGRVPHSSAKVPSRQPVSHTPFSRTSPGGISSRIEFRWEAGKLLRALLNACKDLEQGRWYRRHLIVFDEINRCNLPSVLGELIYLIEPARRVKASEFVEAAQKGDPFSWLLSEGRGIRLGPTKKAACVYVPENLFFLGTMNSSDRSILGFDQALRRRFPPYRIEPMPLNTLKAELKTVQGDLEIAIQGWAALNALLQAFIGPDAMIGHSYWFSAVERHDGDPKQAWRFGVLPQAIHAAESSRKDQFLADIFDPQKKPDEFEETHLSHLPDKVLKDSLAEAARVCEAAKTDLPGLLDTVRAASVSASASVKLIGEGHGKKLIVFDT